MTVPPANETFVQIALGGGFVVAKGGQDGGGGLLDGVEVIG
jgi:hypothetical protein